MIRALAFCAVMSAVSAALAQNGAPLKYAPEAAEPTVALADGKPISACGKQECPAPSSETTSDKPIDDHALLRQKLAEMNCLQSEIESLRVATGTPQQIRVTVKAIEVSRTKMQNMGIDFASIRGDQPIKTPQPYSPPNAPKSASVEFATIDDSNALLGLIKHLEQNNVAKILADPQLAVTCGRPASFNVGGEVPLPTLPGSKSAVEFKPFGTQVDVLAIAQGDNRVRLDIRARVSQVDHSHDLQVGNVRVPGLQVRQIDTAFDLKFGQTGVMSGLVQQRTERQKLDNKVVDIVNEIELLFLVTPEVVVAEDFVAQDTVNAGAYRTANTASEPNPAERSLRVSKPYTPR